jgi:palmitoyltransferase
MFVSQKSKAAPASVDTEQVELRDMIASEPPTPLPLKDDIMKLAMHGDDIAIRALLDSGNVSADFRDEDGLSPVHVRDPSVAEVAMLMTMWNSGRR